MSYAVSNSKKLSADFTQNKEKTRLNKLEIRADESSSQSLIEQIGEDYEKLLIESSGFNASNTSFRLGHERLIDDQVNQINVEGVLMPDLKQLGMAFESLPVEYLFPNYYSLLPNSCVKDLNDQAFLNSQSYKSILSPRELARLEKVKLSDISDTTDVDNNDYDSLTMHNFNLLEIPVDAALLNPGPTVIQDEKKEFPTKLIDVDESLSSVKESDSNSKESVELEQNKTNLSHEVDSPDDILDSLITTPINISQVHVNSPTSASVIQSHELQTGGGGNKKDIADLENWLDDLLES